MLNAAVKSSGNYTLKIVQDENPVNPRKDGDNFGKMFFWCANPFALGYDEYGNEKKYEHLGDKHAYEAPYAFFEAIIRNTVSYENLIDYIKDGKVKYLKLEYSTLSHEWELSDYNNHYKYKEWYAVASYPDPLETVSEYVCADILANMENRDLLKLVKMNHLIIPLYLLNRSDGITMPTQDFNDKWNNGQVGLVYVTYDTIEKKYGNTSPESVEKARALLESEVKDYNCYLLGECYGFILLENGKETDSCWGFLGHFSEAVKSIREYLPEEAAPLAESAEYGDMEDGMDDEAGI